MSALLGQEPNESCLPQFREEVQTHCLLARADDETWWLLLLALLAWGNRQHKMLSMSRCGNTDLGNSGSAFLSPGAVCILIFTSSCMTSIMEAPATLEDGNAPQSRRSMRLRLAFYALMFVLIIILALVPIIFCLLHHQQAPGLCWAHGYVKQPSTLEPGYLNWDWNLKHCNGMVQALGQNLIIQQSGTYFIYAQLYREKTLNASFTMKLYKDNQILLNQAKGHANGTINFARPFFLQKGEKLYCKKNDEVDIVLWNQTYWGLFKM